MKHPVNTSSAASITALPENIRLILRNANRYLRTIDTLESRYSVFSLWRTTMSKICNVDAFYVGFLGENNTIYFPYTYDGDEYADAGAMEYGSDGLCAWLIKNKRPYLYSHDNGWLLNKGQNFGDVTRISQDSVVVPLFHQRDTDRRVMGMASIQSYTPHVYRAAEVTAFQWLANQISLHIARAREDTLVIEELGLTDADGVAVKEIYVGRAWKFTERLRMFYRRVQTARQYAIAEGPTISRELVDLLADLEKLSEQAQTDWIDLVSESILEPKHQSDQERYWKQLTHREQEVVRLTMEGLNNKDIAARMGVDLTTVKSHLTNTFRKLKIKQRSELSYILNSAPPAAEAK